MGSHGEVSRGTNPTQKMGTFLKSFSASFSFFKEFDFQLLDQHGEDCGGKGKILGGGGGWLNAERSEASGSRVWDPRAKPGNPR